MKTITKTQKFVKWYERFGGKIHNSDIDAIINKMHNNPILFVSSLKSRSNEFKERFNHKFANQIDEPKICIERKTKNPYFDYSLLENLTFIQKL